jgi:hypothetical protein
MQPVARLSESSPACPQQTPFRVFFVPHSLREYGPLRKLRDCLCRIAGRSLRASMPCAHSKFASLRHPGFACKQRRLRGTGNPEAEATVFMHPMPEPGSSGTGNKTRTSITPRKPTSQTHTTKWRAASLPCEFLIQMLDSFWSTGVASRIIMGWWCPSGPPLSAAW